MRACRKARSAALIRGVPSSGMWSAFMKTPPSRTRVPSCPYSPRRSSVYSQCSAVAVSTASYESCGSFSVHRGSLRSARTKRTRDSPSKYPSAMASSAGSRSTPTLSALGNRFSRRSEILPVPHARSRTRGSGPTSASTMSSITRNRSSRSGRYHSCWRSQLFCHACQSAPTTVSVIASPSGRNTLVLRTPLTTSKYPHPSPRP